MALSDTAPSSLALDDQGYVYVGTGTGRLLKLSLPTGQQPSIIWQIQTDSAIIGSPVIDANGILYVGSVDSKLYAVDIQTGNVKWTFSTSSAIQSISGIQATPGAIRSTPVISNAGIIYFGDDAGNVFALDSNKTVQWWYGVQGGISAPLLYDNNDSTLYIGTLGHQVIALYAGSTSLSKTSVSQQTMKTPKWSTFQGNNQRTGISSSLLGVTGIQNMKNNTPKSFALSQNFPNPFNPTTTISFTLPSHLFVSLKIIDLLGREVSTIVSEEMPAGSYLRTWNATNMSSGIYFYRLHAGAFNETKKLILLR